MSGLTIRKEDFQELDRCLRFYKKFDDFVKDVKISKFNEFYIECYDSTAFRIVYTSFSSKST